MGPEGSQGEQGIQGDAGPKGDKGDTGDRGPAGSNGTSLHLYDGNGQNLGEVVGVRINGGSYTTHIKLVDGYDIGADFLEPGHHGGPPVLFDPASTELYFTQPNYTGEAFMRLPDHAQQIFYANQNRNFGYFVPRIDTLLEDRTARSRMLQDGCSGDLGPNIHISNTVLTHNITLPFTEPLTWPLEVR